jgi:hypothetical protein
LILLYKYGNLPKVSGLSLPTSYVINGDLGGELSLEYQRGI